MTTYKILIVENDEDEQFFMNKGFAKAGGFEVLAILGNGEQLFEWLDQNPGRQPDLILSDLNMPGMNGTDILEELNNRSGAERIPVVITSTSSTRSIMEKCLQAGAALYLVKPDTFIHYEPFVRELHRTIAANGILPRQAASESGS